MNFTNGVKNKCERIFQGRNMLLQFAGSFPWCSRKAASPLLTREARRPGRKGAQRIKTGLPPSVCKQHLIIKLKKHTNEIKTFSKWAAALRPDFVGPWPANLYLCLNWAPGKVAAGGRGLEARFWCQQEGTTQPVEAGRPWGTASQHFCDLSRDIPHLSGLSLSTYSNLSHVAEHTRLTPNPYWVTHSLSPVSIGTGYFFLQN